MKEQPKRRKSRLHKFDVQIRNFFLKFFLVNSKQEAKQIFEWLSEVFGDEFDDVVKKIHLVMSDNCPAANACRRYLIDLLNEKDPSHTRQAGRCSGE